MDRAGRQPRGSAGGDRSDGTAQALQRLQQRGCRRADPEGTIAAALRHPHPKVQAQACLVAGHSGLLSAGERLLELLRVGQPTVRRNAALGLGLLLEHRPDSPLQAKVLDTVSARVGSESDLATRGQLLQLLGQLGDAAVTSALVAQLGDPHPTEAALTGLVLLGHRGKQPTSSLPHLLPRLTTGPRSQRLLAAMALAFFPWQESAPSTRQQAIPLLQQVLGDPDGQLASWAVAALGSMVSASESATVLDLLSQGLLDHRPRVQVQAARALAKAAPAGLERLTRGLAQLWRSTSANHFRLTGPQLHPILIGLHTLEAHSDTPAVRALARQLVELSDASDAAVTYQPKEAHGVDLVHCAAARLWDLGQGKLELTPSCGKAGSNRVTSAMRDEMLAQLNQRLGTRVARPPRQAARLRPPASAVKGRGPSTPLPDSAKIVTHRGEVVLRLHGQQAPSAVARLVTAAHQGSFRALPLGEIEPFVRMASAEVDGALARPMLCEGSPLPVVRGSVGFVQGQRGNRLYISLDRQPWLDNQLIQIGQVTAGLEVVERLQPGDIILDLHLEPPQPVPAR